MFQPVSIKRFLYARMLMTPTFPLRIFYCHGPRDDLVDVARANPIDRSLDPIRDPRFHVIKLFIEQNLKVPVAGATFHSLTDEGCYSIIDNSQWDHFFLTRKHFADPVIPTFPAHSEIQTSNLQVTGF